jgi:N-succinyl-L-ornithine transcarbamylase
MKQFTSVSDVESSSVLLQEALELKANPKQFSDLGIGLTLGLIFMNPSLRTRLSTWKAARLLGMDVVIMNFSSEGWQLEFDNGSVMDGGTQEHVKEAAGVLSQYCDVIGVRTFAGLLDREADYNELQMHAFIEHASVPIVSLESATLHPLQSLADLITIEEMRTKKTPKVVLTWAPHPKALPQAVANSFVEWMTESDVELVVANPPGFDLIPDVMEGVHVTHDQDEALCEADFVYVKNWSSYTDYGATSNGFNDWTITPEKMELTNAGKCMHCLPVRRNVVIADEVLDGPNSLVLHQAENRVTAAQIVLKKIIEQL